MAKKSGGLASHWDRPKKSRRGKSAFTIAGMAASPRGRKKKDEALGGKFKTDQFLEKAFSTRGRRKPIKDRESAMDFGRMIRRRLTPTERAELNQAVDEEMQEDETMRNRKADATLSGDETFLRRLVALVRARMRR